MVNTVGTLSVPTDRAFVSLGPGAPGVLSIVESRYRNATRQTIALVTRGKTPGENQLRVDIYGMTNAGMPLEATLPDRPLNDVELYSEAQEALPNVSLHMSLNYMQNRLGPFGYAVGRSTQGDTCIYAWQRVATPDQNLSLFNSRVTLSVRLRLCDPRASEAQLAAMMMNLSVNVNLSRAAPTPEPTALSDVGVAGVPMAPASIMTSAADPLPAAAPSRSAPRRPRHVSRRRQPPPSPQVAPAIQPSDAPGAVPPPPVSSNTIPAAAGAAAAVPPQPAGIPSPPKDTRP